MQPLDLSVNKAAKEYLRGEFQTWYAKQISQQVQGDSEKKPVDLRLTAVKSLGAKWLEGLYDYRLKSSKMALKKQGLLLV